MKALLVGFVVEPTVVYKWAKFPRRDLGSRWKNWGGIIWRPLKSFASGSPENLKQSNGVCIRLSLKAASVSSVLITYYSQPKQCTTVCLRLAQFGGKVRKSETFRMPGMGIDRRGVQHNRFCLMALGWAEAEDTIPTQTVLNQYQLPIGRHFLFQALTFLLGFSSVPVGRWWGTWMLGTSNGIVDLERGWFSQRGTEVVNSRCSGVIQGRAKASGTLKPGCLEWKELLEWKLFPAERRWKGGSQKQPAVALNKRDTELGLVGDMQWLSRRGRLDPV